MTKKIMSINSGSSSLKFQLFEMPEESTIIKGIFERIGDKNGVDFSFTWGAKKNKQQIMIENHEAAVDYLLQFLQAEKIISSFDELKGVGHRVAHGGETFQHATLVGSEELATIEELAKLAPLHNPVNAVGIKAFQRELPTTPQVAVFDTSFHQTMPARNYVYPIPYKFYQDMGIRRYGFHGTSHQYVAEKAAGILGEELTKLKIISCHLGNGASICGIKNGESVITSMGFTPLAGLMMGTRSGDLDPSIITYIQKETGKNADEINELLNNQSGLLGISGISNDLRDVMKAADRGDKQAKLALEMFTARIKQTIGAYAAELGGVDVLIFTAGIGENAAAIRQMCCEQLAFMDIKIDSKKNQENATFIQQKTAGTFVMVVPTDEEQMIAKEVNRLI